jgi:predicted TIM-barrel fold metal-dependent hydrolase
MQRIDVHHHFIPDQYRKACVKVGQDKPDGMPALPEWDVGAALAAMDRLAVQTAMLSISSPGVHFGDDAAARALARDTNEEAARLVRDHKGRFGLFAATPLPDVDGAIAEIRYAYDRLDADGIVLETNFHGVYLGDERLEPLYAELNARRACVFIHPTSPHCHCCAPERQEEAKSKQAFGYPRPMLEFIFETTRSVTNLIVSGVLERYPDIRVIVPHGGAALPILASRVELMMPMLRKHSPEAPKSFRESLRKLHYDLAGAPAPELLLGLLQVSDMDRLHYGTDWCFTPVESCEALLSVLNETPLLDDQQRQKIMRDNSLLLFPRLRDA